MEMVIIFGGALFALFAGYIYKQAINEKQIENKLKEGFGIIPENTNYNFEEIQLLDLSPILDKYQGMIKAMTLKEVFYI